MALQQPQKLRQALGSKAHGGASVNCYNSPQKHFRHNLSTRPGTHTALFCVYVRGWENISDTTDPGPSHSRRTHKVCRHGSKSEPPPKVHTPTLGRIGGVYTCTQPPTFCLSEPLAANGVCQHKCAHAPTDAFAARNGNITFMMTTSTAHC